MSPLLASYRYRGFLAIETRIAKDLVPKPIDVCCRDPFKRWRRCIGHERIDFDSRRIYAVTIKVFDISVDHTCAVWVYAVGAVAIDACIVCILIIFRTYPVRIIVAGCY